jgi:enoyl-CoA hydratase/3-hydroxyacyl-CoA dehydrogenase
MFECTLYKKKNFIAWITLNRPRVLNALNKKLWREILERLDQAEKDDDIKVIIITGMGKAFSAGDDIKEVASLNMEEIKTFFLDFAKPTITKIIQISKPVIAAVNGLAYGGGCEIAMLCDLVVASETATFAIPEALIGAIPPVAAVIGPDIVGKLNVSRMMLTGEPVTATEAKTMGLANEVIPAEQLMTTAEKLAEKTMRAAPTSVKVIKRLLSKRFHQDELEQAVVELMKTIQFGDGGEGHKAFLEKRPPKWTESE